MRHPIIALASLAIAAPALAGSAPGFVTDFDISTRAFAQTGTISNPTDTVNDIDVLPGFFGAVNSSARAEYFDDGDLVDVGNAAADLTVAGSAREWSIDAVLDTDAGALFFGSRGRGYFSFSATFAMNAGESLHYAGTLFDDYGGSDKSWGFGELDVAVYRDDVLIHSYNHHSFDMPDFEYDAFEDTGAVYRLEFLGESRSGSYAGPGGWDSYDIFTVGIDVAIVPAPMSAAPLGFGAVLVARRRRG